MTDSNQTTPREIRKILIVGAGAVGGYFGGFLFRSGVDVIFLVHPQTYARISEDGLLIKSIHGDFSVHPPVIQSVSEISSVDLIILSVKCYDVVSVLKEIAPLVKNGAVILTLQNGVDTEEQVLSYFQGDCVVAGVAYITAKLASPGVVEHYRRGMIALGELSGEKSVRAVQIYELFSKAGISCSLRQRILKAKWEKLCWNATFNPLSVILDNPISLVLDSPPLLEVVRRGIAEVMDVAAVEGIDLDPNTISETISASSQFREYYTSMYQDYKKGKPTEIEYLNGTIVRRGKKGNVPTPTHQMLYALVKGLELKHSFRPPDERRSESDRRTGTSSE